MVYGPGLPPTQLPPARYAEIMRIPAPHFHQLQGALAPATGGCDTVWDQDDREALLRTMLTSEKMIRDQLQFYMIPTFITNERRHVGLGGCRSDFQNAEIETKWKYVTAFGTETLTLVEADALVDWQDWDADPFPREEVAVLGAGGMYDVMEACDDACAVAVFFRTEDGAPKAAHPYFEIRPHRVVIDDTLGTMEVILKSSQLVKPTLWNLTKADCASSDDPLAWVFDFDADNLVPRVDVYCRSVNAETPITLHWDGSCSCTSPCAHHSQTACAYVTDWEEGFFCGRPATWSGGQHVHQAALYGVPPERLTVNYRAGYPLDEYRCTMDSRLERAIVKLTNALLPEPPCGFCDAAEKIWKLDRTQIDPLTPEAAGMPWDIYSRGALEAWRIVKLLAAGRGGKLGR
ncbi:MAG TPA: hypothetical protein VM537_04680 [Anaerolineae bacterium]|nr:hypothetical protein [Anaerolineae bacterium]